MAEERKVIYPTVDKGQIITQDKENRMVFNPEYEKERTLTMLGKAIKNQTILSGIVSGVETTENGYAVAVLYVEEHKVMIPLDKMGITETILEQASGSTLERKLETTVFRMIGSQIDYIPLSMDESEHLVVASRALAMEQLRIGYFVPTDGKEAIVKQGSIVEARILEKRYNKMRIEMFGVETWLKVRDMTYEWHADFSELSYPDNLVLVKIMEIAEKEDEIIITASGKEACEDNRLEKLKQMRVGSCYSGTITGIHVENYYVRSDNGANVLVYLEGGYDVPAIGDRVVFYLSHIDSKLKMGIGRIRKISKKVM